MQTQQAEWAITIAPENGHAPSDTRSRRRRCPGDIGVRPLLKGGGGGCSPRQPQRTHLPTHIPEIFLTEKLKFVRGGGNYKGRLPSWVSQWRFYNPFRVQGEQCIVAAAAASSKQQAASKQQEQAAASPNLFVRTPWLKVRIGATQTNCRANGHHLKQILGDFEPCSLLYDQFSAQMTILSLFSRENSGQPPVRLLGSSIIKTNDWDQAQSS